MKGRGDEGEDCGCVEEVGPALFVDALSWSLDFVFDAVFVDYDFGRCLRGIGVQEAFGVEGCLREETVGRWDAEDAAEGGGEAEKNDVLGVASRFADAVAADCADYATDFVVEEEENCDDEAWDHGSEDPGCWELPKRDVKIFSAWTSGTECFAGCVEGVLVDGSEVARVWYSDEEDDAYCRRVFSKAHAEVLVDDWRPTFGSTEEQCEHECSHCSDDCIQKRCLVQSLVSSLEFLHSLVEVDDTIQQTETLAAELRHVEHSPVMGIENSQEDVHPPRMDQSPSHELKEIHLKGFCA